MLGLLTTGHSHERKRVLGSLLRQAHTQAHLRLCRDPSCGCHVPTLPPPRSAEWPRLSKALWG